MDKCPTELLAPIVEQACIRDPTGKTARSLGLVSKHLRAFAEPLEFRALVIAGPEQLKAILAKLKKAREARPSVASDTVTVDVRHLFIHDLKSAHALAVDTPCEDSQDGFWGTFEGQNAISYYRGQADELDFWECAATLVRSVSTTLVTLTAIQYSWDHLSESPTPKSGGGSLRILSELYLPRLESLALKDDREIEEDHSFVPPTAPSLQRLHLITPLCKTITNNGETPWFLPHPLLMQVHPRFGALTHLTVCIIGKPTFRAVMAVLSGSADGRALEPPSTCVVGHQLPGNLNSAVIQVQIPAPRSRDYDVLIRRWMERAGMYVSIIRDFCIRGLEVRPPRLRYPGEGNRTYELLLAEWKEWALIASQVAQLGR
ncbi:hypothetical protein M0805_007883 [Coniferiporia weirii]|nr:hypothetical protein M0805_007883 [Coniferiporia weirii]